jgi:sugar lactone lactonase YvrE
MFVRQPARNRSLIVLVLFVLSLSMIAAGTYRPFPATIPLPGGFGPEGIASGNGTTFFVGSIPTGDIFCGDLRTGEGDVCIDAPAGRAAIGIKFDPRSGFLFVAGGPTGEAYVYDVETGETVAELQLTTGASFINDVAIAKDAAYFTNSAQPVLYGVPLERNGQLSGNGIVEEIPLDEDFNFVAGEFNANGIAATPNGKTLIIVNSWEGVLYTVDLATGDTEPIDLGRDTVTFGDGILLQGKTLYVVRNQLNQIAVVELNSDLTAGTVVATITSANFEVPTTIARFGNDLYAVNARFGLPPGSFEVVRVPRK